MISTLKWLEWLYITGTFSRFYTASRFHEIFLSARLDFVTTGAL